LAGFSVSGLPNIVLAPEKGDFRQDAGHGILPIINP
jgi:hypothetical protein